MRLFSFFFLFEVSLSEHLITLTHLTLSTPPLIPLSSLLICSLVLLVDVEKASDGLNASCSLFASLSHSSTTVREGE